MLWTPAQTIWRPWRRRALLLATVWMTRRCAPGGRLPESARRSPASCQVRAAADLHIKRSAA